MQSRPVRSIVTEIESLNLDDMRYNMRDPFSEIRMSATIRRKTKMELKKKWNLLFCFFFPSFASHSSDIESIVRKMR